MLCKHGLRCGCMCQTSSILATLVNNVTSYYWIALLFLLNWFLCTFRNGWVHIIWTVPVGVEPFPMLYGWVRAPPTLQQGVDPTFFLCYDLFFHTHTHGRVPPVGIIWVSRSGKWRLFLIRLVRSISITKFSSLDHESHWNLFPWLFISCLCRS